MKESTTTVTKKTGLGRQTGWVGQEARSVRRHFQSYHDRFDGSSDRKIA